jgi:hypothetical protein
MYQKKEKFNLIFCGKAVVCTQQKKSIRLLLLLLFLCLMPHSVGKQSYLINPLQNMRVRADKKSYLSNIE